jgi:thiamine kinase-like enzyme
MIGMFFRNKQEANSLLNHFLFNEHASNEIEITALDESIHEGTFPATIVSLKTHSGEDLSLRIKYATRNDYGYHKDAINYESKIYDEVLRNIPLSTPKLYGYSKEKFYNFLLIEYIRDSKKIKETYPEAFGMAAGWIAKFHDLSDPSVYSFLKVYDDKYFITWAKRVEDLRESNTNLDWFYNLCRYFRTNVSFLTSGKNVIVHGEFYGKNILIRNEKIYPIDWETCGAGPCEIDLAALIDGKDDNRANLAIAGYVKQRYPNGVPEDFGKRLVLAELYFKLRWVAEWVSSHEQLETWLSDTSFGNRLYKFAVNNDCI